MEEPADFKKAKDRSPSFPFIPLERALERAKQFYDEEKRGVAPYTRVVMHWKYTDSSSGGLQTVAALKAYGLLDEMGGSAKARQFKLSDLALRILLDQRPDSSERDAYLRQASLLPSVAQEVYTKWPDGLPSDSTLNHFLVLERKFNEATASMVIKIIKQNQQLTNASGADIESPVSELKDDKMIDVPNANALLLLGDMRAPVQQHARPVPKPVPAAGVVIRNKGVTITLEFSEEPTQEVYEYLEKWAKFERDNVPTKAQLEAATKGEPNAS